MHMNGMLHAENMNNGLLYYRHPSSFEQQDDVWPVEFEDTLKANNRHPSSFEQRDDVGPVDFEDTLSLKAYYRQPSSFEQ